MIRDLTEYRLLKRLTERASQGDPDALARIGILTRTRVARLRAMVLKAKRARWTARVQASLD
jgi:hypothetical protein